MTDRPTLALLAAALAALCAACGPAEEPPAADAPADAAVVATHSPDPPPAVPMLSADDIRRERLLFRVEVLGFDASRPRGEGPRPADSVRLRVANGSRLTLPCLTVHTTRWSGGEPAGRSRTPPLETDDLAPGEVVEMDYFPTGHLDSAPVDSITVEVREIQQSMAESSICELRGWR